MAAKDGKTAQERGNQAPDLQAELCASLRELLPLFQSLLQNAAACLDRINAGADKTAAPAVPPAVREEPQAAPVQAADTALPEKAADHDRVEHKVVGLWDFMKHPIASYKEYKNTKSRQQD